MNRRRSCLLWFVLFFLLVVIGLVATIVFVPSLAWQSFGAPGTSLNAWQRFGYALDLVWNTGDLTQPRDPGGVEQVFVIQPGESVVSISDRLEQAGLIRSASTFRIYLLWTGLDTILESGTYHISPAQTGREIAEMLKSTTLTEVPFNVLPGWRMDEIAASLPTSGLDITPAAFLATASAPCRAPPQPNNWFSFYSRTFLRD